MNTAGDTFTFHPGDSAGGEGRSFLQQALARWVLAHGGDAALAELAVALAQADANGDSALPLDADTFAQLAAQPLVGDAGSANTPFVREGGLLYLRRNHAHEVAIAGHLRARMGQVYPVPALPGGLFAGDGDGRDADQRAAVAKAVRAGFFVLSGGPGSGKTTTVLRILMALTHAAPTPPLIRLAAPTGKAAQRLAESLRLARPDDFPPAWQAALAHVQAAQTGTVHRLLESQGSRGNWRRNRHNPVAADIVVVDEASMLDLASLRALLEALPAQARLLLVGDAGQLDAVGTGSVLQDIVAVLDGQGGQALQWLRHSFRADRALLPLIEAVRLGRADAFFSALAQAGGQARWQRISQMPALHARLHEWGEALLADMQPLGLATGYFSDAAAVEAAMQAASQRQLLTALREGEFGAEGVNRVLDAHLAKALGQGAGYEAGARWYPGRRVLITRNDPASGLWNGDVGLCLASAPGRLAVWFRLADGTLRAFEPGALPEHSSAFAMTVHKAQGSEYPHVAVLLPPEAGHRLLGRQWFYTAISRAKTSLDIWGDEAAIAHAIGHRLMRVSGLVARLVADG